jgi:hypothetical protein
VEACDDGNAVLGDGCDSSCAIETPPPGCRLITGLGRLVSYCPGRISWFEGRDLCSRWGGDLLTLHTGAENDRVWQYVATFGEDAWIGLNDRSDEGRFEWDGSSSNFRRWRRGEPDNNRDEDCVRMRWETGDWETRDCSDNEVILCQKP